MTIKKNLEWGTEILCCPRFQKVDSDHEMAQHLDHKTGNVFVLEGGSLFESLGSPQAPSANGAARSLPFDVMSVVVTYKNTVCTVTAVNDVFVRNKWRHGGWLRGPLMIVTNSGIRRGRQIATRAHPNDGHLDIVSVNTMNVRERLLGWSRTKLGNHVPHPKVLVSRATRFELPISPLQTVVIDGHRHGQVTRISLTIVPDAAHVLIASGSNL